MTGFGPRAGGLRLIRMVLVCVAVGVIANSGSTVLLFGANAARVDQINEERADNIRRACVETNGRYSKTVAELDRLLAVRTRGMNREQLKAVEASRAATVVLIASLAPRRDCDRLVASQVKAG